jgi:hypothetical protein
MFAALLLWAWSVSVSVALNAKRVCSHLVYWSRVGGEDRLLGVEALSECAFRGLNSALKMACGEFGTLQST